MSLDMRQVVRSPEQVELDLPLAGPTTRILAFAIDWVVMLVLQIAIWLGLLVLLPALVEHLLRPVLRMMREERPTGWTAEPFLVLLAAAFVLQFLVELGYFVFLETATAGQSLGKRLLKLRVVRDDGFPITVRHSLVRNLLRAVDGLPWSYVVGFVAMVVSDQVKRLGDVAAGTLVVRLDRPPAPRPVPALVVDAPAAFVLDRTQITRIGPPEVALALETLRRIDGLPAEQATVLLEQAARALCARLGHPPVPPEERDAFLRAVLTKAGLE